MYVITQIDLFASNVAKTNLDCETHGFNKSDLFWKLSRVGWTYFSRLTIHCDNKLVIMSLNPHQTAAPCVGHAGW